MGNENVRNVYKILVGKCEENIPLERPTLRWMVLIIYMRGCIQKFPDWPPAARTANGTALCHQVQFYRYFVSQSSEFCRRNSLYCISTSVYCCSLFLYQLSLETFGYFLVLQGSGMRAWTGFTWFRIGSNRRAFLNMEMKIRVHISKG
jgi:hypothetical protein